MSDPLLLEGSCHCGAVRFSVETRTPYPYRRCYCSRCRKTAGGTGAAANLLADASTLRLEGRESLGDYTAQDRTRTRFCGRCGSALYLTIEGGAGRIYPFASAIDTPLPEPPETVHVFVDQAPAWAAPGAADEVHRFARNTSESIEDWHRRH